MDKPYQHYSTLNPHIRSGKPTIRKLVVVSRAIYRARQRRR